MRRHVILYLPQKDGSRLIDHLNTGFEQQVEEFGEEYASWPEEYPLPDLPEEAEELWLLYWELRHGAGSGFSGPEPLKYSEIFAWSQLTRNILDGTQLYFIRILDGEYLSTINERTAKQQNLGGGAHGRNSRPRNSRARGKK